MGSAKPFFIAFLGRLNFFLSILKHFLAPNYRYMYLFPAKC